MSVAGIPLLEDNLLTGLVQQFPYDPRDYPALPLFPAVGYATDELTWDIVVGTRGMAELVTLGGEGNIVGRDGVKKGRATPAHMKEKTQLTNVEVSLLRAPGATGAPGTAGNPEKGERAITRTMAKLRARQLERKNWLCAQALQNGSITYAGDKVQFTVSYGLTALTAPGTLWDNAAATMIKDIMTAQNEFADNAGVPADTAYFNPKMFALYAMKNTEFLGFVKANPGLSAAVLAGSMEPFRISGINLEWRPMVGQYVNDAGSLVDRWAANKITLAALRGAAGMVTEWGVVENMENDYGSGPVGRSWQESGDSKMIWVLAYDNGVPVIRDPNRFQTWTIAS